MADDIDKIPNGSGLLRRIHPEQHVPDGKGGRRLSSAAFRDAEMSVDAENFLLAAGLDWNFSLGKYPQHGLVRLQSTQARQLEQSVEHRPLPNNPYHAEVIGKKTGSVANAFRDAAEWVKRPP